MLVACSGNNLEPKAIGLSMCARHCKITFGKRFGKHLQIQIKRHWPSFSYTLIKTVCFEIPHYLM